MKCQLAMIQHTEFQYYPIQELISPFNLQFQRNIEKNPKHDVNSFLLFYPQQPQIVLLKEGTDTSQGKPQVISNINACQTIVDAVS
jgi:hypothetical protein